jgi:ATP-GRASP peptide maturase of grasp-with-spasm system
MRIIISEEKDITTNIVIDWLRYYNKKYIVFNSKKINIIKNFSINNDKTIITIDNLNFNSVIDKIWHRRGKFNFTFHSQHQNLNKYLKVDEKILLNIIENELIKTTKYIGSYTKEVENNKLEVLIAAKNNALNIPNTFITSSKKELQNFYDTANTIITKDLHHPVWFKIESTQYSSVGTIKVTQEMIDKCNEYFIPMFLQEMVEKKYEIRIFHYKNKLYPMAIFSQNDKKTAVDYRNYNDEKPNRNVPILIPKELEIKIFALLKDLDLNTCSIDFIFSTDDEYVFLEVNPMGQLDWVSKNGNYYIEKHIAEDLMA